jgi:hypothetical protein
MYLESTYVHSCLGERIRKKVEIPIQLLKHANVLSGRCQILESPEMIHFPRCSRSFALLRLGFLGHAHLPTAEAKTSFKSKEIYTIVFLCCHAIRKLQIIA